jgi:solute carrier family 24 (sodium/potassium/calcium exchanger), member 6
LENCEVGSHVNYYHIYFCSINESNLIFLPIAIISMYICFWALGSTADAYLSPILASISKHLRLSQSLAGVTLLAFGNGAPDVFASISAASSIDSAASASLGSGFYLAAAISLGGGLFVS